MSQFAGVTTTALGVGINAAAVIRKGHDPFPAILAGGLLVTAVVLIGGATDPRLASAFGAVFLLGCALVNGPVLLNTINGVIAAKK